MLGDSVTDHVPCWATVNGFAHWVVCMEHVEIWRLAGLYAEDMSAGTRTRVISVAVWLVCMGSGFRISGVMLEFVIVIRCHIVVSLVWATQG